jgi:urea transport system permease protein
MSTSSLVLLQIMNTAVIIGILCLVSLGLGIIYGLMNVINLAHGEFVMIGAYGLVIANIAGLNVWLGYLIAPIVAGLVGLLVERGLVQFLYKRPFDSLLATWGVSLILVQLARLIFGPAPQAVATPIEGAVNLFGMPYAKYRLFVLGVSVVLTVIVLIVFRYPTFGIKTRAVFQDAEMAKSLGIRAPRIYSAAFVIGAALAGFAGALVAPLLTVQPDMGGPWLVQSFLTVIVGGAGALIGTVGGSAVMGGIQGAVSYFSSSVIAQVITLSIAILVIRIRPNGIFSGK